MTAVTNVRSESFVLLMSSCTGMFPILNAFKSLSSDVEVAAPAGAGSCGTSATTTPSTAALASGGCCGSAGKATGCCGGAKSTAAVKGTAVDYPSAMPLPAALARFVVK